MSKTPGYFIPSYTIINYQFVANFKFEENGNNSSFLNETILSEKMKKLELESKNLTTRINYIALKVLEKQNYCRSK